MIIFDSLHITSKALLIVSVILIISTINTLFLFLTDSKQIKKKIVFRDNFFSLCAVVLVNQLCVFLHFPESKIEVYHAIASIIIYGYILIFRIQHWGLRGFQSHE